MSARDVFFVQSPEEGRMRRAKRRRRSGGAKRQPKSEASKEDQRHVSAELTTPALRATPPLRGGESLSEDYLDRRAEPANNPRLTSNPNAKFRKSEDVYAYSNSEDMGCSRTLHGAAADRSGPSPVRHRHI